MTHPYNMAKGYKLDKVDWNGPNGCWVWLGKRDKRGYGMVKLSTKHGGRKQSMAHRRSYIDSKGPIPIGYEIDHLCKNPSCINPEHLEAVLPQENARRAGQCRLTAAQVTEIRTRWVSTDGPNQKELAQFYGVAYNTIYNLLHPHLSCGTWKDIPWPEGLPKRPLGR